jgi:hypothetical protein
MGNINTIVTVNLTTVEDCLQLGQFEQLVDYFLWLLNTLNKGAGIILKRFPNNSPPIDYEIITIKEQFKVWVEPFLNRI